MAIAPYLFMAINITIAILTSLSYTYPEQSQICFTTVAYNSTYVTYATWVALITDNLGIIIYVVVIFEYRRHFSKVNAMHVLDAQVQRAINRQRKVSIFFGVFLKW